MGFVANFIRFQAV